MRIVHIVAGLPPGSGIATVVPCLCARLRALGHEVMIVTLSGPLSETAQAAGVRVVQMRAAWPRFLFFSWQMLRQLPALCRDADVVHVHSNWTFPAWWGCRCALRAGKPLVMSPHGCLDPVRLRHAGWKKRLVGWLDRGFLRRAAVVHATSEKEREWAERFLRPFSGRKSEGKRGAPRVVVVPNGVLLRPPSGRNGECKSEARPLSGRDGEVEGGEHPCEKRHEKGETSFYPRVCDHSVVAKRTVLYLGRLHPLKGLELLVEAWGRLRNAQCSTLNSQRSSEATTPELRQSSRQGLENSAPELPNSRTLELPPHPHTSLDWRLVIAGPDEQGTRAALERQARELGLMDSITFTGAVYGEEKDRLMEAANLFVLPSRSENFGLVVAEALAAGVPVIATQGTPWQELMGQGDDDPSRDDLVVARTRVKREAGGRCGWWVEVGVAPLAEALLDAMSLTDEERCMMGKNGRRLVEMKYRWEAVAERMIACYRSAGADD